MNSLPEASVLNAAMASYLKTFPLPDQLELFIKSNGLEKDRDSISTAVKSVVSTAEKYLFEYPDGVPWDGKFQMDYLAHLKKLHPWLDSQSIGSVLTFSRWICWHDGLNRQG